MNSTDSTGDRDSTGSFQKQETKGRSNADQSDKVNDRNGNDHADKLDDGWEQVNLNFAQ